MKKARIPKSSTLHLFTQKNAVSAAARELRGVRAEALPKMKGGLRALYRTLGLPGANPLKDARVSARLCRLLRDEATEQLALKSPALTSLAMDWRKLLFPKANDKTCVEGEERHAASGLLDDLAAQDGTAPGS